jgi:predicted N-acetyltransferase YhbS
MPGLPEGLNTEAFFTRRGYYPREGQPNEWDVARSLSDYVYPAKAHIRGAELRPVQPGEAPALLSFLEQAFPGRWLFEAQEYQRHGGRMSDYMLLWTDKGPQGFCQVTFEDSLRPIERFYPQRLPRPWGQLGPLGVAAGSRGKGYGGYLIHAALHRLQEQGVDGCVIEWTTLLELYARFGFQPYSQYTTLLKTLGGGQHV